MVLGQERPDAWAFLVGMLVLAAHLIRDARREPPTEAVLAVSVEHVRRVRSNLPYIAVLGAVYGLATHMGVIMEGPQSLLALARGDRMAAVGYTFVRALSYIPLRTMSILSTGVFTMEGLGFAPTAGLLSPSPFVAAALGAAVMTGETLSLVTVARVLGRYPCMLRAANSIRTAMTRLLDLASLIGGMVAANALIPGFGFFAVAGVYCLNEVAGAPIIRAAIGPICIVAVALLANLLRVLG
jgi:hypothetical protein